MTAAMADSAVLYEMLVGIYNPSRETKNVAKLNGQFCVQMALMTKCNIISRIL